MAPFVKFIIPLIFGTAGLAIWLTWANWIGLIVFVGLFFFGSSVGTHIFNRIATPEQIRQDLARRRRFH
ncbi:MAG: UPF0716 family protein affecting phage T7 exclusion [Hyphomicrobiaceae bacterium]|jgi:hypothetical protein